MVMVIGDALAGELSLDLQSPRNSKDRITFLKCPEWTEQMKVIMGVPP